jgi:UDP-glucose 4-epimerase
MQFVHESDLNRVLLHAVRSDIGGTFNVAGDGILMLSQAIRRLQRATLPMPGFAVGRLGSVLRQMRVADFSPEQLSFLTFGRGIDTTRMRTELGFEPEYTTAAAFADFASSMPATSRVSERAVAGLADLLPHPDAQPAGAPRG